MQNRISTRSYNGKPVSPEQIDEIVQLMRLAPTARHLESYKVKVSVGDNEFIEKIGNMKYTIQRSKGLGENDADMMWLTTMNPATRRLIKVEPNNIKEEVDEKFELLLGDNLQGRKEHIAENGYMYIDLADLS